MPKEKKAAARHVEFSTCRNLTKIDSANQTFTFENESNNILANKNLK